MAETGAIGVFDSGMGGLTVLAALERALPGQNFVYLGDMARLPYGTKSPETITNYALQAASLLARHDIKLLVVACNTASAVALPALQRLLAPVPVMGVVEPGAEAGVRATRNRRLAVIATESTVRGGAYLRAIAARDTAIQVIQQACPLFVSLAEEGWTDGLVAMETARRYLAPIFSGAPSAGRPDTLVLGCTHFQVLGGVIAETVGTHIAIVDSAETTAAQVKKLLAKESGAIAKRPTRYLVTDSPERFIRVGARFLGAPIKADAVEAIDLSPLA